MLARQATEDLSDIDADNTQPETLDRSRPMAIRRRFDSIIGDVDGSYRPENLP